VYWLFYAGFLVGRHGVVHWHGSLDGWRMVMIAAAGLGAAFVARVWRLVNPPRSAPVAQPPIHDEIVATIAVPDSPAELFRPRRQPAATAAPRRSPR
jgi:hypothetical protein